jgi:hypothetical protein
MQPWPRAVRFDMVGDMARYFFDLLCGERSFQDPEGMELADAEAAMEHARTAFRVVAATRLGNAAAFDDCLIEVLNEDRRRLFTVLFTEAHQAHAYKRPHEGAEQPPLIAHPDEVKGG